MKSHSESSEISMKTSSRVVKGLSTSTEKFISLFAVTMFGSFQFIPLRDELPVVMIPCLRREILQGYRTNAMPFFFFFKQHFFVILFWTAGRKLQRTHAIIKSFKHTKPWTDAVIIASDYHWTWPYVAPGSATTAPLITKRYGISVVS